MSPRRDRLLRRLPLVRLRLLQHLLLQRWLPAEGHLVPLALQALAEGVADVADVAEGLLRERPLPVRLLPAWAWEAAVRQRLRHRACSAASSWWLTSEGLNKYSAFPRRLKPRRNFCVYGGTEEGAEKVDVSPCTCPQRLKPHCKQSNLRHG